MMRLRIRTGIYQAGDWEEDIESRCDQAKTACDSIRNDFYPLCGLL